MIEVDEEVAQIQDNPRFVEPEPLQPQLVRSVNNPFADSDRKLGATPREPSANNPFVDKKEADEPMQQNANAFGSASILDNLI